MANPFLRVVSPEISSFQMSKILGGGHLQELPAIGLEVPLSIKTYFATHGNQALQTLFAKFKASQDNDRVAKA